MGQLEPNEQNNKQTQILFKTAKNSSVGVIPCNLVQVPIF